MWEHVELQEIRGFLALCDRLHFGRAADDLGLSSGRVSQLLRSLETKIGGRLFERTSRQVRLTALGAELEGRLRPVYGDLQTALASTAVNGSAVTGRLRVGLPQTAEDDALFELTSIFEDRYPACSVEVVTTEVWDPYGGLRDGTLEVLCYWNVGGEPDLTVGPVLRWCEHAVAVGRRHRLASRASVSFEEIADEVVNRPSRRFPQPIADALCPPVTAAGRPITFTEEEVGSPPEIYARLARGDFVRPTVAGFRRLRGLDQVVLVPIHDLPPIPFGLIWATAAGDSRVRALAELVPDPGSVMD